MASCYDEYVQGNADCLATYQAEKAICDTLPTEQERVECLEASRQKRISCENAVYLKYVQCLGQTSSSLGTKCDCGGSA